MVKLFYLMPGAANDGGEDSPGGVITGETGLAHAGAIVHNQSGDVLVTHVDLLKAEVSEEKRWGKMQSPLRPRAICAVGQSKERVLNVLTRVTCQD